MQVNKSQVVSLKEAIKQVKSGRLLVIAADRYLLERLPKGNWIGGSIPYFMTPEGGVFSKDKLIITDLNDYVTQYKIVLYDETNIDKIPKNYFKNGLNYILIPGFSDVLKEFAIKTELHFDFFYSPLVGWVTGADLNNLDNELPVIINGQTGEVSESKAIVLHAQLPEHLYATVNIVNIFEQGDGDIIIFDRDSFEIYDCYVNGENVIFADYLRQKRIDKSHPLVANYNGVPVNVSIKDISDIFVETFAPVRKGVVYRFARRLKSYEQEFSLRIPVYQPNVVSSFNCIYNYIYGKLENKQLPYTGPFTFGEIAYILLNQTMVTLEIKEREK